MVTDEEFIDFCNQVARAAHSLAAGEGSILKHTEPGSFLHYSAKQQAEEALCLCTLAATKREQILMRQERETTGYDLGTLNTAAKAQVEE